MTNSPTTSLQKPLPTYIEDEDKDKASPKLGYGKLGFPQNLMASLMMLFMQETDNPADDAKEDADPKKSTLNQTFAEILGFKDQTEFKQWRQEMRDTGWNWQKSTDFSRTNFTKAEDFVKNPPKNLLDLIARHESGGDYNVLFGNKHADMTSMTIDQVLDLQHKRTHEDHAASSAAGKYQMLEGTLKGLKQDLHLTGNEKFDENMQDQLAVVLMKRRGLNEFMNGKIDESKFMHNLALEWASLPKDLSGKGAYDGDGLNKAFGPAAAKEKQILADVKATGNVGLSRANHLTAA